MSTIIDALKRSDRERQINTTHTMSYSHLHSEDNPAKTWIKYALIALLITVVCIAAITLWFNKDSVATSAISSVQNSSDAVKVQSIEEQAPEVIVPKTEISQVQAPKVERPEKTVIQEPSRRVQNSALASIVKPVDETPRKPLSDLVIDPVSNNTVPDIATVTEQTIEITQAPAAPSLQEQVITMNDFMAYDNYSSIRASQSLPELHLDILMYHPDPSQRKAFINMQAYRQGEQISEGAQLLEIGQKGVLLRYQGKDFVLSAN